MWHQPLIREIALILILKLAALWLIWLAFFRLPDSAGLTHHDVGKVLLGEPREAIPSQPHAGQLRGLRNGS